MFHRTDSLPYPDFESKYAAASTIAATAEVPHNLFLPAFFLYASTFLNGNPLVRLSAPVRRLIFPAELPNSTHHNPIAAKNPYPARLRANDVWPVCIYCVYA